MISFIKEEKKRNNEFREKVNLTNDKMKEKQKEEKEIKRKERKKSSEEFNKKYPFLKTICIHIWSLIIVGCFVIGLFTLEKYINTMRVKDTVVGEVKTMVELYKDKIPSKGERKTVDGFELERDTLPFMNFASNTSPGGNCEGYNAFELLAFEGKLNEFLGENEKNSYDGYLKDIDLFKEDIDLVYSFKEKDTLPYLSLIHI